MPPKKKHNINLELPEIHTIEIGIPEKLIKNVLYNPKEFNTFTKTGNIRKIEKKHVVLLTAISGNQVKIISEGIKAANKISDRKKELDEYSKKLELEYKNKPRDLVLERLNELDKIEMEKEKREKKKEMNKSRYDIPSYMYSKHIPDKNDDYSYGSRYDYLD